MSWAIADVVHAATPTEIDILYQNPFVFDASGRLLGAYTAGGEIFNSKGYQVELYISQGHFVNWPIYFESSDCSGQGYTRGNYDESSGYVFITHEDIGEYFIAYTDKDLLSTSVAHNSWRRYRNDIHGGCETYTSTSNLVPVFPNDPEITGVPNGVGLRDNPYPIPFFFERYEP